MGPLGQDLQFFGLTESASLAELKAAYRQLLLQYHPDLHPDDAAYHWKMIRVNLGYRRLEKHIKNGRATEQTTSAASAPAASAFTITPHKDPAYVFYKQGMLHYQRVDQAEMEEWMEIYKAEATAKRRQASRHVVQEAPSIIQTLNRMIHSCSQALHYFSIVLLEYGQSPWAADSRKKMERIQLYLDKNLLHVRRYLTECGERAQQEQEEGK